MQVTTIDEFKALIQACRELGVTTIEVGDLKASILPFTEETVAEVSNNDTISHPEAPAMSEDDVLYWSSN